MEFGKPICNPWGPMFQHLLVTWGQTCFLGVKFSFFFPCLVFALFFPFFKLFFGFLYSFLECFFFPVFGFFVLTSVFFFIIILFLFFGFSC